MSNTPNFANFLGQRILVVGGSSGIGLATAALAAQQSAQVTVAGRDPGKLDHALAAIGGARAARLDMIDPVAVEGFFATHDPFDHVIVTAAALISGPMRALPLEDARATFDAKFWGPYTIARYARIADHGSLTLVSGAAARRPRGGRAPVAAASSAVEALTKVLASEFAPIRVNCVAPGLIDTPMLRAARPAGTASHPPAQPVARAGHAEEVAFQILACAANPYMTGAIIDVDGGILLT
jgi:NAD(P)-dependent dehydrogenase (short-subunit alcohol dehydrogenase family)